MPPDNERVAGPPADGAAPGRPPGAAARALRRRKLIGAFALLVLLVVWVLLGLALAPVAFNSSYALAPFAFYAVAGLGWLAIAMPLVKWMSRLKP